MLILEKFESFSARGYEMNGDLKYNNPSDNVSDIAKTAIAVLHEIGHVVEDQVGNKVETPANDKKTVGFENKVRKILGLNPREGNLHGQKQKDGTYKEENKGAEEPSK
jgi:hypothetical protein